MITNQRDMRLDLFRGLGLLVIYSNHIAEVSNRPLLMIFSWRLLGVSDAAELFIFISGFVAGLVYYKTYLSGGFLACQKKALYRSFQLYLANLLTLILVLLIVRFFYLHDHPFLQSIGLEGYFVHPRAAFKDFLLLDEVPGVFDVLYLYVFFILALPVMLYLLHRSQLAGFLVSLAIYIVAFTNPQFKPFGHFKIWSFDLDPMAWQFLFFVGLSLGMRKRVGTLRIPQSRALTGSAMALLLVVLVLKLATLEIGANRLGLGWLAPYKLWLLPLSGKLKLEPLRLLHFAALAYLAWRLVPMQSWLVRTLPARLIINCGKNSLKIFCLGIFLSYLVSLTFDTIRMSVTLHLTIVASGWMTMLASGWGLEWLKRRQWRRTPGSILPPLPESTPQKTFKTLSRKCYLLAVGLFLE